MTPREAAYCALLASLRQENFITHSLEAWQQKHHPSSLDFAFALEIASGSARMALALDHIAAQLSTHQKLSLKLKERALLRTAIYQHYYMDKVPLYAIVNETINIGKKYCHRTFVSYLNAMLRQLNVISPTLPTGDSTHNLSVRYSYPEYFVQQLVKDYGQATTIDILNAGNQRPVTMVRLRPGMHLEGDAFRQLTPLKHAELPVAICYLQNVMIDIAASPGCYIQNATPATLIADLAQLSPTPQRILDLCASPGGKLLAAHDAFPQATLYANDISPDKLQRLTQNLIKYKTSAQLSCGQGEDYPTNEQFDIVILDVPCSNSGVLNKRSEARWRLTPEALQQLKLTQQKLLAHASKLINKEGVLWYLTCSILKEENEQLLAAFCQQHAMRITYSRTVLPNVEGWDGGYACLLQKS